MVSQLGMEEYALSNGLSLARLYAHLLIAYLDWEGVIMKVHSNILVADQNLAIRSSANLNDRCLSPQPTDSELGVLLRGPAVAAYSQAHYRRLLHGLGDEHTKSGVDQHITLTELCRLARADTERRNKGQRPRSMIMSSLSPIAEMPFQIRELGRSFLMLMTAMSEGAVGGLETNEWCVNSY